MMERQQILATMGELNELSTRNLEDLGLDQYSARRLARQVGRDAGANFLSQHA